MISTKTGCCHMKDKPHPQILFLIQLPLPIHGASLMNKYIRESMLINTAFDCTYIDITTSKDLKHIGKFDLTKYLRTLLIYVDILKKLLSRKCDACYITLSPHGPALLKDGIAVLLCKMFGTNIIIHLHGKGIKERADQSKIKKFLYKRVFKNTNVICLSNRLIHDISAVYNGKPCVLNYGIPDASPTKKRPPCKYVKLLFLSNFVVSKGILVLIDALKILHERNVNFKCNLVGKEFDISYPDMQNLINNYNLKDQVSIVGAMYGKDKDEQFLKTDIMVFPTFYDNEAFPLVILEAMMHGLPVISTYEGGIPDIIDDGITGFLVHRENPIALADKIQYLIDHPNRIREMGDAARRKYEKKYKIDTFQGNFINIVKMIVENN